MNFDQATNVITNFWQGLWPNKERSAMELSNLASELQKDAYDFEEVCEFLRRWHLTQKYPPNPNDLTQPFLQRSKPIGPVSGGITTAELAEMVTELKGVEAVKKYYLMLLNRSSRSPSYHSLFRREMRNSLIVNLQHSREAADRVVEETFKGEPVIENPPPAKVKAVVKDEPKRLME